MGCPLKIYCIYQNISLSCVFLYLDYRYLHQNLQMGLEAPERIEVTKILRLHFWTS